MASNAVASSASVFMSLLDSNFLRLNPQTDGHLTPTYYSSDWPALKVKVKVTLRLAVYCQSVRLGDKPLETHDQRFFFQPNFCCNGPYVTSFLTKGWIYFSWIGVAFCQVFIALTARYWKFFLIHYIKVLCRSRLCKKIMLILLT
jgi:hypothetical protein